MSPLFYSSSVDDSSEEKHNPRNQINDEDLNRKSSINQDPLRAEEHKEKLLSAIRQVGSDRIKTVHASVWFHKES